MTPSDPETPSDAGAVWKRGLIMLIFAVGFTVAEALLGLIAVLQFLWLLIDGAPNPRLAHFGRALGRWLADVAEFQSCATERRPFPWSDWPSGV